MSANKIVSATAPSFDAKLAKVVAEIREMIFIDLDTYPAPDEMIASDLKQMISEWATTGSGYINRCLGCGVDMGECNPRQYCRKTYCPNQHS